MRGSCWSGPAPALAADASPGSGQGERRSAQRPVVPLVRRQIPPVALRPRRHERVGSLPGTIQSWRCPWAIWGVHGGRVSPVAL